MYSDIYINSCLKIVTVNRYIERLTFMDFINKSQTDQIQCAIFVASGNTHIKWYIFYYFQLKYKMTRTMKIYYIFTSVMALSILKQSGHH